jgi:hypothetical protein
MIRLGTHTVSSVAQCEGAFLETALPVVAFASLTTPRKISRIRFDGVFKQWIDLVQAEERVSLGWVRAYEQAPYLHAHAAIIATAPIHCRRSEDLWMQVTGSPRKDSAKVESFEPGIYGVAYILKTLGTEHEDIAFSPNIPAFVPASDDQFYGRTPKERRARKRILLQGVTTKPASL